MHRVQTSQPRPELREFVRAFGLREMSLPGVRHQQSNVSCLEHTIAFDFGTRPSIVFGDGETRLIPRVHYVGSQTSPSGFSTFTGNVHGFGIFLRPLAPWQLFRIPLLALANHNFDGIFAKKDLGAWTIPKGEYLKGEDPLQAAKREFQEEMGFTVAESFVDLGSVKQAGGKTVSA